jgi:hypothetical protein
MKKIYDVIWSETSEKDPMDIVEYIAGDSLPMRLKYSRKLNKRHQDFILFLIEDESSQSFKIKELFYTAN